MNTPATIVLPRNNEIVQVVTIDAETLKAFFVKETLKHFKNKTEYGNISYLEGVPGPTDMVDIYAVYHCFEMKAFAIVPTYVKSVLSRIYVSDDFRNKGVATLLINQLQIKSLGCVSDNTTALSLYSTLGFKVVQKGVFTNNLER